METTRCLGFGNERFFVVFVFNEQFAWQNRHHTAVTIQQVIQNSQACPPTQVFYKGRNMFIFNNYYEMSLRR